MLYLKTEKHDRQRDAVIYLFAPVVLIATSLFLIFGCRTGDTILYHHRESELFYSSLDVSDSRFSPWRVGDIVFVLSPRQINFQEFVIWFAAYSELGGDTVEVRSVVISGEGGSRSFGQGGSFDISDLDESNLMWEGSMRLALVRQDLLDELAGGDEHILLTVDVVVSGQSHRLTYRIERIVETRVVFPT